MRVLLPKRPLRNNFPFRLRAVKAGQRLRRGETSILSRPKLRPERSRRAEWRPYRRVRVVDIARVLNKPHPSIRCFTTFRSYSGC